MWKILTDFESFEKWNPFIVHAEGVALGLSTSTIQKPARNSLASGNGPSRVGGGLCRARKAPGTWRMTWAGTGSSRRADIRGSVSTRRRNYGERGISMAKKRSAEADPSTEVRAFLQGLKHRRKDEVLAVREVVLSAHPEITEHIKWKAPSFCIDGDDRITFRLQPKDLVQLVFHRGARRRDDTTFSFEERSGLLEWVAEDRAVVTFGDLEEVKAKSAALKDVARRWMTATRRAG